MRLLLTLCVLALAAGCHGAPSCTDPCAAGATCGTANGLPVCRAPGGVPRLQHAFVIVMENTSLKTLQRSSSAPYLQSLLQRTASSANYHGVQHPSLPNYLALVSGGTQGVACDCEPTGATCQTCNAFSHGCGCKVSAKHLGDQLLDVGYSFRAYAEEMGPPCNLTSGGGYAARHVPFLYFDSLQSNPAVCASEVVDYSRLTADLNPAAVSLFFITPNLTHDMHDPYPAGDQNLAAGDAFLADLVPRIQASPGYKDRGAIFIVWDEDDLSGLGANDDPVPLIVLSPLAKGGGYVSAVHADHYSLLATLEDAFGVPRLGAAAQATPLADFFPAE